MKTLIRCLAVFPVFCWLAVPQAVAQLKIKPNSSPVTARQDARKIAVKFRERGYRITPLANGDNKHSELIFDLELTRGVDCVIMVGIDEVIGDVDLYLKDEVGNMLQQDTRNISRACVEFSASYNGVYTVIVDPAKSRLLGHFAVLVGVQPGGFN